jgi:hypothetical protein
MTIKQQIAANWAAYHRGDIGAHELAYRNQQARKG